MEKRELKTTITVFDHLNELPKEIQTLFRHSFEARENAYAPYSKFKVGAALLLSNEEIVIGSNQENAAYPSGLCAERTAIFAAGAQYPDQQINALVVSVKSAHKKIDVPTPPCGACRQAIAEYEFRQKSPIAIYFTGESGAIIKTDCLLDLLPLAFDNSFL